MDKHTNMVHILFEGYSRSDFEDPNCMRANCSCTLIQTCNGRNIVVDTMTAWDGEHIVAALKQHQLRPSDIHVVICTHGHADHIGCNYLFPDAQWHIVGTCVSQRDKFFDWCFQKAPFNVDAEEVMVVPTPGHTLSCVSVLVRNTNLGRVVGVCGDLFERMEDIAQPDFWLAAGSEDATKQRKHRLEMAKRCNYIVPGHGPGFKITEHMCEKLYEDLK